jgi:Entner-Doudoroff aldolase
VTLDLASILRALKIVPVIVIDDAEAALPLADALSAGGLACAEITFRTTAAAEAIRRITADRPGMLVGAGTVLSPEQVHRARAAGAAFIVSPGLNPRVVELCQSLGTPVLPGVVTPSEIERAREMGLAMLKFFPAEAAGGPKYLKAVGAPYQDVAFVPTGGISAANLAPYLALDNVIACGGSWMAPAEWIAQRQFDRIRDETERATLLVRHDT